MGWQEWRISADRTQLIGPCGCRVANSHQGLMEARGHKCPHVDQKGPDQ